MSDTYLEPEMLMHCLALEMITFFWVFLKVFNCLKLDILFFLTTIFSWYKMLVGLLELVKTLQFKFTL